MKDLRMIGICTLALLTFSCGSTPQNAANGPWTEQELVQGGILDLSELGTMTYGPNGTALIGGRAVPSRLLDRYPYTLGHTYVNVLHLDSDTLAALPNDLARALVTASPAGIREYADRYGIGVTAIREAVSQGGVSRQELFHLLGQAENVDLLKQDAAAHLSGPQAALFTQALDRARGDAQ